MPARPLAANKGGRPLFRPQPAPEPQPEREERDTQRVRDAEMVIQRDYRLHAVRLRAAWILRETGVLVIPDSSLPA